MATARDNVLGRCRCPVCSGERASLRLSKRNLAYVVCDGCNVQTFARSDRSDDKLRALLLHDVPPLDVPPIDLPVLPPAPIAAPPPPAPAPAAGMSWGVLGGRA